MQAFHSQPYRILAECDGHLFRSTYELPDRSHTTFFRLLNGKFYMNLLRNKKAARLNHILKKTYEEGEKCGVKFAEDDYNGYGSFNATTTNLNPKQDFSLIGLLAKLPAFEEDNCELSVFRKTRRCSYSQLMVGPARFVNHGCEPNAVYSAGFFEGHKCVKIEFTKTIRPGEEIVVRYAHDYFGEDNIDCRWWCPRA